MTFVYLAIAIYALGIGSTLIWQGIAAWRWDRRARRRGNARVTSVALARLERQRRLSLKRPHDTLDPHRKRDIRLVRP